jgi:catechol-2,3-dioxygenase
VLWVSDPERSSAFYRESIGLVEIASLPGAIFLKAPDSPNDHDLGLFAAGGGVAPPGATGLYHLAWEVPTLRVLSDVARRLAGENALVGASDHALTKSLYAKDPDGIEFEVMWQIPGDAVDRGRSDLVATAPLDLDAEIERYGLDTLGGWQEIVSRAAGERS